MIGRVVIQHLPQVPRTGSSTRIPNPNRSSFVVRAQLSSNHERDEDANSLNRRKDAPIPRFFAVDSNPPMLTEDWRQFRAQLIARETYEQQENVETTVASPQALQPGDLWAHTLPRPEKGCLLLARRPDLGMFAFSVVLIVEHGAEGTSGLVINMPVPQLYVQNFGLEEDITKAFGDCPAYVGGPLSKELLHVLHFREDVEGCMKVVDGVYAGGIESCTELVLQGKADPSEFRLLAGYAGWGPMQLEYEIQERAWWVVAASPALVKQVIDGSSSFDPMKTRIWAGNPSEDVKVRSWNRMLEAANLTNPYQQW